MKKIMKSFTFWCLIFSFFEIFMHQIGQDSKSIVLIRLNPLLNVIADQDTLYNLMDSGWQVPCNTITGQISIYWYIGAVLTFLFYGIVLDGIKMQGDTIMGVFRKLKKEKSPADWNNAYTATPQFYGKPNGDPFGTIALTEGTETILPKNPQNDYAVDGKKVSDWKMVLISTTKEKILGDSDYLTALKRVEKYILDSNNNSILIRGLSLEELENVKG